MKRQIPLLITGLAGLVLIVSYFIPYAETWGERAAVWFDILAAIAFVLGGGNLLRIHLKKISDQVPGWGYSGIILISFTVTLIIGLGKVGVQPSPEFPDFAWSGRYSEVGTPFWFVFEYAFSPLGATMFAMLAFYIASASFRAFRAKNLAAGLLLGTAFIILLGRTFAGVALTSWIPPDSFFSGLRIENLTVYIMSVFNTAGQRAIMIGIALGAVATALKILLGMDRSYLGKD
jgi:hypothetical protein